MLNKLSEKEKGYLFGLFEGDGYKFHDKNGRRFMVDFYLNSKKDKEIIDQLLRLLYKLKLNPNLYQDKRYNCKRIRVHSKELFNLISKKISLNGKNFDFNLGYLSGMIDSEGYVNPKKSEISIINTNKECLEAIKSFLDSINITNSLNKRKPSLKDRKESYRLYISTSFKLFPHLSLKTKGLKV